MAISTVLCYDATSTSYSHLPRGQHAGYTTGSGGIAWTSAQWAADPSAVRIDQDYYAGDHTADVLDVENGAATPADCPVWVKATLANYRSAARHGQRSPAIYCNGSTLSAVCNSLIAGGVTSGVGIWLANWNLNAVQAAARVVAGSGPFPIIGIQFSDAGLYDISVFSVPWLDAVSGSAPPAPPPPPVVYQASPPPGNWKAGTVTTLTGTGSSGGGQWKTATGDGLHWSAPVAASATLPAVSRSMAAYACSVTAPGWWKEGTPLEVSGTGTDGHTWRSHTTDGKTWAPLAIWTPPAPPDYGITTNAPGWYKAGTLVTLTGTGEDGTTWTTTTQDGKTWTGPVKA